MGDMPVVVNFVSANMVFVIYCVLVRGGFAFWRFALSSKRSPRKFDIINNDLYADNIKSLN